MTVNSYSMPHIYVKGQFQNYCPNTYTQAHTHTHRTECSTWITKVVSNKSQGKGQECELENFTRAGAQSRFQSWGVQFLGLGYCTEQNAMVYPVSWTALCFVTVITLFIKNVWGGPSNFFFWGGVRTPRPLSGCALVHEE